jgi:hypothetical protein
VFVGVRAYLSQNMQEIVSILIHHPVVRAGWCTRSHSFSCRICCFPSMVERHKLSLSVVLIPSWSGTVESLSTTYMIDSQPSATRSAPFELEDGL